MHTTRRRASDRFRRAEISKGLLITFVIAVVAVAVFWTIKAATKETVKAKPGASPIMYVVTCDKCGASTRVTATELKELPYSEDNSLKCPKCGEFAAHYNREGSPSVLPTPEGG